MDIEPCNVLRCDHYSVRQAGLANPPREPWEREDVYRVRVQTDPDALEPGAEPTFELVPFW